MKILNEANVIADGNLLTKGVYLIYMSENDIPQPAWSTFSSRPSWFNLYWGSRENHIGVSFKMFFEICK